MGSWPRRAPVFYWCTDGARDRYDRRIMRLIDHRECDRRHNHNRRIGTQRRLLQRRLGRHGAGDFIERQGQAIERGGAAPFGMRQVGRGIVQPCPGLQRAFFQQPDMAQQRRFGHIEIVPRGDQ